MNLQFQKINALHHHQKNQRSESNPVTGGPGPSLPNPSQTADQLARPIQALNTISHPSDYAGRSGQYANQTNRVSKPQFSAKNAIEPISGPKAPPQMQNFDNNMEKNGRNRGSDRLRSLEPGQLNSAGSNANKNLIVSPRASATGGLGKSLTLGGPPGTTRLQYQAMSQHKTPKLSKTSNTGATAASVNQQIEQRRSLEATKTSLSKDYYSAIGVTSNPTTSKNSAVISVGNAGGLLPNAQQTPSYFNKKITVSQRTAVRRNAQYSGIVSDEEIVPYPPNPVGTKNQSSRSVKQNNQLNQNQNQSLSFSNRNASQMRTAQQLEESNDQVFSKPNRQLQQQNQQKGLMPYKSHTNSQTIEKQQNNSTSKLQGTKQYQAQDGVPSDPREATQSPDSRSTLHRKNQQVQQRKNQLNLQGMARNKVTSQYASNKTSGMSNFHSETNKDILAEETKDMLRNSSNTRLQEESNMMQKRKNIDTGGSHPGNSSKQRIYNANSNNPAQKQGSRLMGDRRSQDLGLATEETSSHKFGSVASRIASIAKTPKIKTETQKQMRVGSQDPTPQDNNGNKATSMVSGTYPKTGSGPRNASFRQNFGTLQNQNGNNPLHAATDELGRKGSQIRDKDGLGPNAKNNNYLTKTNQKVVGRSLNAEDFFTMSRTNQATSKASTKHQTSSKLIESFQINPFNQNQNSDEQEADQEPSTSSLSQIQSNTKPIGTPENKIMASTGVKIRQRISQAKINQSNNTGTQQPSSAENDLVGGTQIGRSQSMNGRLSGALQQQPQATQGQVENSNSIVPSTGGSDEQQPKPNAATQPAVTSSQQQQKQNIDMFNFNTTNQTDFNPLKDFEPAKFASKTHGLITSYAANTHQGIQRNYNEDRVSIILNMTKPSSRKDVAVWPKCSFFAIYDGHGGSACSDFLKDQLHLIIINQESFPRDPAQALTTGCLEAERKWIESADSKTPMHERSGSCGIVVLIVGKECYVANVGDSRAIMSADKGKKLFLLSRDHKPNEDYEVQRIVQNGGGIYQTQSIQNVQIPGAEEGKLQQHYILGPHRVIPGRLSVSRTFGDIEAKHPKYGGKEGVIIAQPEISQFTVRNDFHDFIVLGCDGIFDRLSNQQVLDASWDTINSIKSNEVKNGSLTPKTVHQVSGEMADAIIKQSAIERSMDNLTIVIVTFDNMQIFLSDRPKPTRLEAQLFQIKEVESGATSTIVQPTPALTDSVLNGLGSVSLSPRKSSTNGTLQGKAEGSNIEEEEEPIAEVRTEEVVHRPSTKTNTDDRRSITPNQKKLVVSRTQNQSNSSVYQKNQDAKVVSARRNRSKQQPQAVIKQSHMTRNKVDAAAQQVMSDSLCVKTQNSEQLQAQRRGASDNLPKLPQAHTVVTESGQKLLQEPLKPANNKVQAMTSYLTDINNSESPKQQVPLRKSQIANFRFSKTQKQTSETTKQVRSSQARPQ